MGFEYGLSIRRMYSGEMFKEEIWNAQWTSPEYCAEGENIFVALANETSIKPGYFSVNITHHTSWKNQWYSADGWLWLSWGGDEKDVPLPTTTNASFILPPSANKKRELSKSVLQSKVSSCSNLEKTSGVLLVCLAKFEGGLYPSSWTFCLLWWDVK